MKTLRKVIYFGVVCLMTWAVTKSLVAQQKKQTPLPAARLVAQEPKIESKAKPLMLRAKAGELPQPKPLGTSGSSTEAHLRSQSITVEEGIARVKAHISLYDQRKGMSYIWRLRVVDRQATPLAGQVYDQQIFKVDAASHQKEVDFEDTVAVPPGARRIELVLYEKADKNTLWFLNNDDDARAYQMIRVVKLLTD